MTDMTMKKGARSIRKGIFEHKKRTSPIYEQLAHAPLEYAEHFLRDIQNPLVRRYARERIETHRTDVVLNRVVHEELDPLPFVHEHEGCMVHGQRFDEQGEHDVFAPRVELGFVGEPSAYQEA